MGQGPFRYKKTLKTRVFVNQWWQSFCPTTIENLSRGISWKYPDRYYEGLQEFQRRDVCIDLHAWNKALFSVRRKLREEVGFSTGFSFDEAVKRILYSSRGSSPGFEWNKFGSTKGDVLTNEEALLKLKQRLEDPNLFETKAIFTMSLKDELRDKAAGKPKKARVFFPCELALILATVMVYGRWNDRYVNTFFDGSLGGGFLNGGTERLMEHLSEGLYGDGDAHKFDSKQQEILRNAVYGLRDELVSSHPLKPVVKRLLCRPRVCTPEGQLFQLPGGNPSGSFNTLIDNSILTLIVLAYCFFRKFPNGSLQDFYHMVTGDDYIYRTKVDISPDDIKNYGSELGLEYDGGQRRELEGVSFCQRKFVKRGGYMVSIPDPSRFLATMAMNRCYTLFDTCVMSQSMCIEHFFNEEVRAQIRRFQEWAATEVGPIDYLTDDAIFRLHTVPMKYEIPTPAEG